MSLFSCSLVDLAPVLGQAHLTFLITLQPLLDLPGLELLMLNVVLSRDGPTLGIARRESTVIVNICIINGPFRFGLALEESHQSPTNNVLQLVGIGYGADIGIKGPAVGKESHGSGIPIGHGHLIPWSGIKVNKGF